ncbi:MAG: hypothetical protein AB7L65_03380 [Hyphomonadaceae bacterium]
MKIEGPSAGPAAAEQKYRVETFAPLAAHLRAAADRSAFVTSACGEIVRLVEDAFNAAGAHVLAVSLFDVWLLGDRRSAPSRAYEAACAAAQLVQDGARRALDGGDILAARLEAARVVAQWSPALAQAAAAPDALALATRLLGLPPQARRSLREAELEGALAGSLLNPALAECARILRRRGARIVLCVNAALDAGRVREALSKRDPAAMEGVDAVYALGPSLAKSALHAMERAEQAAPTAFLFVTESLQALHGAQSAGWAGLHFPVSDQEAAARSAEEEQFWARLRAERAGGAR